MTRIAATTAALLCLWAVVVGPRSASAALQDPSAGADPVVVEDFSDYGSTSELLSDPRGIYGRPTVSPENIELDTSVGVTHEGLSQSMRYDYDGVGTIRTVLDIPSPTYELWVEVWARFSPNFRTDWNQPGSNPDFKFVFAVTDPGRFELKTGRFGRDYAVGAPRNPVVGSDPSSGLDWDGEWHRYRMHFRHESSDGACDGTAVARIDGRATIGSEGDVCTNRRFGPMMFLYLGANMNQVPKETISLWWGRVAVWTDDPGW